MKSRSAFTLSVLVFGFAFLYIPILSLIVYSFNKSRLATVWGGFSTEWYWKLFQNDQISYDEALRWATNVDEFKLKVQGISTTAEMARDEMAKSGGVQPDIIRFGG